MGDSSAVGEGRSGAEGTPGSENASSPDLAGSPGGRARVSIVDVAQRAGVSVATVSRALRAMPNVSSATRERVLAAADELQYTASPLAAGLVTGRIRSVGVVTRYAGRWFFAEVVRGIEEALHAGGYDLVLHVVGDPARRAAFFADLPLRRRVDAVLVVGLPLDEQELVVLRGLNVPLACVGEPIPGLPEIAPPVLAGMETYDSPIPMAETARTFGVEMTPLAATIRGMLGGPGA